MEGIRLICMRSMYMIANLTTFDLKITPVVVKTSKEQTKHDISSHLLETSSFVLTNQKPSSDLKYVQFSLKIRFLSKYYISVSSFFCFYCIICNQRFQLIFRKVCWKCFNSFSVRFINFHTEFLWYKLRNNSILSNNIRNKMEKAIYLIN